MTLHPDVQRFANLLREIEAVLNEYGEKHWAARISHCSAVVDRSDAFGVHQFLAFFGGMGSLSDLQLHRGGQPSTIEKQQFHALLTQAYEVGHRLVRDD